MPSITVTTTKDLSDANTAPGSATISLRDAIVFSESNPGTTIHIPDGTYTLDSDLPLISQGTNFIGAGIGNTIIDGASTYRGFLISGIAADGQNAAPTNVTISGLSVQNVVAAGGAGGHGGGGGLGAGGAVFVGPAANLTLDNVSFSGATAVGGAAPGPTYNGYSAVGGGGGLGGAGGEGLVGVLGPAGGGGIFFPGGNTQSGPPKAYAGLGGGGGITSAGSSTIATVNGGAGGGGLGGLGGGGGGSTNNRGNYAAGAAGGTGAGAGSTGTGGSGGFGGGGGGGFNPPGYGGFGGGGGGGYFKGGEGGFVFCPRQSFRVITY